MKILLALTLLLSELGFCQSQSNLTLGQIPTKIVLSGKEGGLVKDDSAWDSETLKGKISIIFYVAPKHKDLNKEASEAIKAQNFNKELYQSYGIVNMEASAWPNFLIASKIRESQKEYPNTIYVKDVHRSLVKNWGIKDDTSDVLVTDAQGKLMYRYDGKMDKTEIQKLISLLTVALKAPQS